MTPRSVELLATAEEQCDWLRSALTDADAWCLYERHRANVQAMVDASRLVPEMFGNEFSNARFTFGRRSLGELVWLSGSASPDVDHVASHSVTFEPSVAARRELIAGRIAILSRAAFEERGLTDRGLVRWYGSLVRSLRTRVSRRPVKVFVTSPSAPAAQTRLAIIVSDRAREAHEAGSRLVQVAGSRVHFELRG